RRVIAKLKKADEGKFDQYEPDAPEDLGFKAFKLAPPNIHPWMPDADRDPDAYEQKLALFNDPLEEGRNPESVVWEIALREGCGLNTRFEQARLSNGNTIYEVTDPDTGQEFAVCLDDTVRADLIQSYEVSPPGLLVCRDTALDDTAAANL